MMTDLPLFVAKLADHKRFVLEDVHGYRWRVDSL